MLQRQDEEAAATPTADESRAAFEQGQEAYASGRYEEAIRQFEAAMGAPGLSTEDLADLVWNMALCRARMGDEHGAMTDAMTYGQYQLAHQTELVLAIRSIIHGPSEEERGSVEAGMPQTADEARSAFQQGQEAYASGRYEEAIRQFEAAMGAPDLGTEGMADLIWNMALCRAHLGDEDGAMTDAMTYGQYGPAHQDDLIRAITSIIHGSAQEEAGGVAGMPQTDEEARAEFELGREAHDSGRYAEALRHFEAAIGAPGLDPSRMPDLIWNTALARARLGDQDGAMTDAMTYGEYRSNQGELIRAITSIIHGSAQEGAGGVAGMPQTDEEARAEFELGREAHDSGRYAEALRHFEAAIGAPGLDPSRMPDLIWNTALARARLGDQDGAMTDAMTYGEYRPNQEELIRLIRSIINGPSEREAEGGNAVAGE